jgi:hypothetical protein
MLRSHKMLEQDNNGGSYDDLFKKKGIAHKN